MKRISFSAAVVILFLSVAFNFAFAYEAKTTLLPATGVSVTINRVEQTGGTATPKDPTDDTFIWTPATSLAFGNLILNEGIKSVIIDGKPVDLKWSLFLPKYFYAIDVGLSGGGFDPSKTVTVTYTKVAAPTGLPVGDDGLGNRASITYAKVELTDWAKNLTKDTFLEKVLLRNAKNESLTAVTGGWLRLYVGVNTADPNALHPDPVLPEWKIFTSSDPLGDYSADLTLSLF